MSAAREEVLSPDELRKRLYQTFKNRGVLDTLKTQLRNQLIQELKQPLVSGGETLPRPVPVKSESLLVSASNSVVADHLRKSGYEYTLSVFYPESGLCKDKVRDLLQFMKISFLMSLLTHLTDHHAHGLRCDADTQTTSVASYRESLVDKMKMIDKEYENIHYRGDKWLSYESKLAAHRKEIEAQMEAEMKTKMQHFKDVEIAKVKMEENAKSHKEFDKLRQDMERNYDLKAKALMDREKNAIDRLQKQQEIEEKNIYMQRQTLLKEIEALRNSENELKLRVEAFEKTCKIHEEKVKSSEELLRRRELAVKTLEDTHDQRLKNELSRYQLELKEEFIRRTEKLTENENRNKVETARIQKESAAIDAKLEEHSKACSELRRLQVELDTSQQQISLVNQQKELLREKLETMSDYPSLKREKVELQGQLRLLKKQLEEAQEENRFLRADLGKPSKEQLALQTELRRLQSAHRLDKEEFDSQKQVLQAQLQSEVERCAQLKAQLIECEEKAQWMTSHAEEIKMQLRQTQQGGPLRGHRNQWVQSCSPDSDIDLVAGAKARIRELEKEAETLEEAYRTYQQRAVRNTISHMLPPRPLSPQRPHPSHCPDSPLRKEIPHHSRPHSPRKSNISHRSLSPQRQYTTRYTRTPSPVPCDTRNPLSASQPKVTFSDQNQTQSSGPPREHGLQSLTEPLFNEDGHPQNGSSLPSRHSSSTHHSPTRRKLQTELAEGIPENILPCQITSKKLACTSLFVCQEINSERVSCDQHFGTAVCVYLVFCCRA
uniref:OFD1 centriole and centriolar satellite protein n=1 Tax=Myripristis murdjan TaxID=586833 RepID=A0A668AYP5_9TELE